MRVVLFVDWVRKLLLIGCRVGNVLFVIGCFFKVRRWMLFFYFGWDVRIFRVFGLNFGVIIVLMNSLGVVKYLVVVILIE